MPLPTIDQLKHQHSIPSVNTGRQFTIPSGRPGIIADDQEKLLAMTDQEGLLVFRSGVEFPLWTFRGQTAIHLPCLPGIARCDELSQQFLAWCRNVAFVDALLAHPYVEHCRRVSFNGSQLRIHYQGIAQHYGMATNMLDTTTNFDVAAFFAACTNDGNGVWRPAESGEAGVIYAFPPIALTPPFVSNDRYLDVGWQPLQRPAQQRASAVYLFKDEDFAGLPSVAAWPFRHDRRIAERLLEQFDGGAALFPVDAAASVAANARTLRRFTMVQITQAAKAYEIWHGQPLDEADRKALMNAAGIEIIEGLLLDWSAYDLETDEAALHARLKRELAGARTRWTF
ncbi:FRG domain-containing protein [Ectothiorhodosinus mongolicus]|uniref:FRG domain-containing protein n=1 Tax=Ectothiorhodosinus mongolicus TaxID=233100 RepID=A0A1R3VQW3_9GAMM|nr:FRG domain-containing protein [Ectothiorhodosinus mongolicus]ULX56755.1 FRG domain-containing protein [Ectothiorhodosinus mongolicus]SIT67139.1 FRG domain-containing protein [Ectothiorhodosinus mongolicus]